MLLSEPTMTDATNDELMALDWSSLGRLVRRQTLEAVAAHFAANAEHDHQAKTTPATRGHNAAGNVAPDTEKGSESA